MNLKVSGVDAAERCERGEPAPVHFELWFLSRARVRGHRVVLDALRHRVAEGDDRDGRAHLRDGRVGLVQGVVL